MILLVLATTLALAQGRFIEPNCDGVVMHNMKYDEELLHKGLENPYQLTIDYDTNVLFFSYAARTDGDIFRSAFINLNTDEFALISGINGGFATAVDSKQRTVYLGGRDGIYKFNFETKTAEHIEGTFHNIWQLFFRGHLCYTTYPKQEAYIFENGTSKLITELSGTRTMLLTLDSYKNIYFSNTSGLFLYDYERKNILLLGYYNINSFTSDVNGNIFFSTPQEIYSIDTNTRNIEKLITINNINNIYGLAIESDGNFIYALQTSIVRLKTTNTHCTEEREEIKENKIENLEYDDY